VYDIGTSPESSYFSDQDVLQQRHWTTMQASVAWTKRFLACNEDQSGIDERSRINEEIAEEQRIQRVERKENTLGQNLVRITYDTVVIPFEKQQGPRFQ
jgi:hypothetical protein